MNSHRFAGKVALVTGGGSGIGQATALQLAREGARVVVSDVDADGGAKTVYLIGQAGGDALFFRSDVSKEAEVQALMDATVARYGRLDIGFNNAGIGGTSAATGDYPMEGWNQVIGVNLTGAFLCMKYEIQQMLKQGGSAIVNNASILGTVGFANAPAYVAAKHGLLGLTKTAAIEYATRGIRINAVCPGFIETPMLERAGLMAEQAVHDMIAGLHPIKRLGRSEEVAMAVAWLCSDEASFVVGHPLLVDGGYVSQ